MNLRTILFGVAIVAVSFIGATLLLNLLWPATPALQQGRPALVAMPPVQPLAGTSVVLAPAAIAITAIRDALDANAPRNLSGKPQNPFSKLMSDAQLNFTVSRGPFTMSGQPGVLTITTPLSGSFEMLGTISGAAGSGVNAIGGAVGNLLGGSVGQQVQGLAGKAFNQKTDIQGSVTTTSRPAISPNWRLAPNIAAQVNVVDVVLPVAGIKLSVANEVKPVLDGLLRDQANALESRLRGDPFIELAARNEWKKLCRAVSLGAAGAGMPNLWLEIRPVRAIAAQPKIDANAVTLLVGVQAQTRIVPSETKPDCPFPRELDLVPQANDGTLDIAVPIDMPFTEVSRLIDAQLKGKTFPEDGSGSFATTIKHAEVAASGDRLLISLLVNVRKHGVLAVGADANVHVLGRPVLDAQAQILRFTDVALDVQSKAAFGLLGEAAQAAIPYLQRTLANEAVIDLKPFAADAKKRIGAAVSGFAGQDTGIAAAVTINDLRLTGIAYDDKTLRIIADAKGNVTVAISSLSGL
jgi:hypothetical protein